MNWDNPLIVAPLTAMSGVFIAWAVSWFSRKKTSIEAGIIQDALTAKLLALETQGKINEQERLNALKLAALTVKTLENMEKKQDDIALVIEETHKNTNASKTKMETIEADLRARLEASDLAKNNLEAWHVLALQTSKDTAAAELRSREAKIDDLQRQLTTMAQNSMPSTPLVAIPAPVPAPAPVATPDVTFEAPASVIVKP